MSSAVGHMCRSRTQINQVHVIQKKKKIVSNPVIGRRAIAAHDTINLF